MDFRIHAYEPVSRANGPGRRAVVWTQGCSIRCPGCFNPATHNPESGRTIDTAELAREVLAQSGAIDGVTISGGEPTEQPEALLDLLTRLVNSRLSRMMFSGHTLEHIHTMRHGPAILAELDVLVAGPFIQTAPSPFPLLGSQNQKIHFLTGRHTPDEIARVPRMEVVIHKDGTRTVTGLGPARTKTVCSPIRSHLPEHRNDRFSP